MRVTGAPIKKNVIYSGLRLDLEYCVSNDLKKSLQAFDVLNSYRIGKVVGSLSTDGIDLIFVKYCKSDLEQLQKVKKLFDDKCVQKMAGIIEEGLKIADEIVLGLT